MNDTVNKIIIGASGIGANEMVQAIIPPDPTVIAESGGLIIQIVIGIITLWKLLRGNKNKEGK